MFVRGYSLILKGGGTRIHCVVIKGALLHSEGRRDKHASCCKGVLVCIEGRRVKHTLCCKAVLVRIEGRRYTHTLCCKLALLYSEGRIPLVLNAQLIAKDHLRAAEGRRDKQCIHCVVRGALLHVT